MTGTCSVEGCKRKPVARGWCRMHWKRWRKHGDPNWPARVYQAAECSIDGCSEVPVARGWCNVHYSRWGRWQDPTKTLLIHGDDDARFLAKVVRAENGCGHWTGRITEGGYGQFGVTVDGLTVHWSAHRWSYQRWNGPIPDGWTVDHLCHNADLTCKGGPACLHRRCVWPEHLGLEPTAADNLDNSPNAPQHWTHCVNGHPFDEENTMLLKNGKRGCHECHRIAGRATNARKKAGRPGGTHCPEGHPFDPDNFVVTKAGWRKCILCGAGRAHWFAPGDHR